ncbi:MAG: LytR/AlgR family response regulator transcription factor [Paludibacteraceae bacterium]
MIRAIAIDDEPPALSIIEHFCRATSLVTLVRTFTSPSEALEYLRDNDVDLLFIDIQMPDVNGIEFYKNLAEKPRVIFTTAFSEYAVEGFNVNAIDYLLKPYTRERFNQAINKAVRALQHTVKEKRILTIRSSYGIKSIPIDDIVLLESMDDHVIFNLQSAENLEIRITLKKLLKMLPPDEFMRVHRSYIVSLRHISEVRNKKISIADRQIPVSANYEKNFFQTFQSS